MTPESQSILNAQLVKVCLANHVTSSSILSALVEYIRAPKPTEEITLRIERAHEALEKSINLLDECIKQLERDGK